MVFDCQRSRDDFVIPGLAFAVTKPPKQHFCFLKISIRENLVVCIFKFEDDFLTVSRVLNARFGFFREAVFDNFGLKIVVEAVIIASEFVLFDREFLVVENFNFAIRVFRTTAFKFYSDWNFAGIIFFRRAADTQYRNAKEYFFHYFPLNVVIVFSSPAVPKERMISEASSSLSGSFAFSLSSHSPNT